MDSIKELRKRTGAPIGAVKDALQEQSGDIDAAIDHLRKVGATMVAKKAHRLASEGLISISISPDKTKAAIVELNSETDFVARTPQFGQLIQSITQSALSCDSQASSDTLIPIDVDRLLAMNGNNDMLSSAVSSLGENIVLRRASLLNVNQPSTSIFGYVHGTIRENSGKIGVLVAMQGTQLDIAGPRVAMHITAAAPSYINLESVPEADIEKERAVLIEVAKAEQNSDAKPKPAGVLERIADGRLKKWFSEVILEQQEMLVEGGSYTGKPRSVSLAMEKEFSGAKVVQFARFAVGDKLETSA